MKYYPSFLRPKSHLHAGCMAPIIAVWLRSMSTLLIGPLLPPELIAHPVIVCTDGPVLLILAGGLGHVLHNPGTTHSSTLLFKGTFSILCLPGGKTAKAKPRLTKQLPREQKHNVDVLRHSVAQLTCGSYSHLESITLSSALALFYS